MKKSEINKLIKAVKTRMDWLGWDKMEILPVENPEDLRFPEAPTWNSKGKCGYDLHIVYWTHRDAYTNKGGKVKMSPKDRWATFIAKYTLEEGNDIVNIEKVNSVCIKENIIHISTDIKVNNRNIGTYNSTVDMDTHKDWGNEFAVAITSGKGRTFNF